MNHRSRRIRIALITAGSVVVALVLFLFAVSYFIAGDFRDNKAQDAVAPLEQKLQAIGGQKICEDGDAGYGPDNQVPWYYVYYTMPDSAAAQRSFFREATTLGYPLRAIKRDPGVGNEEQPFNSIPKDDSGLGLDIWSNTTVPVDCNESAGVRKVPVSGSEVVFEIEAPTVSR